MVSVGLNCTGLLLCGDSGCVGLRVDQLVYDGLVLKKAQAKGRLRYEVHSCMLVTSFWRFLGMGLRMGLRGIILHIVHGFLTSVVSLS
jgi:hypothetical protein